MALWRKSVQAQRAERQTEDWWQRQIVCGVAAWVRVGRWLSRHSSVAVDKLTSGSLGGQAGNAFVSLTITEFNWFQPKDILRVQGLSITTTAAVRKLKRAMTADKGILHKIERLNHRCAHWLEWIQESGRWRAPHKPLQTQMQHSRDGK